MSVAVLAGVIRTARSVERCAVCYGYHLWFVKNGGAGRGGVGCYGGFGTVYGHKYQAQPPQFHSELWTLQNRIREQTRRGSVRLYIISPGLTLLLLNKLQTQSKLK